MKYILIGISLMCMVGCANVKYSKLPDGSEEFIYKRWFKQSIQGFEATKLPDGTVEIKFEGQEAGVGDLAEALLNMSEVAKKVTLPIP